MAKLCLEAIGKHFGEVEVLRDLSLDISDGEFHILVGPSGCGKSTILRLIAGLEELDSGRIVIGDRDVSTVPPKDRDIAMVFQNYALYPHMSVADNLAFALKLRKVPRAERERRVHDVAEILGIEDLLDRKPKALSGGQRQRVAMGRAIIREPAVFLFDEPLSNLDAKLRVQMRAEIGRLHLRLCTTTVYVTHDQVEAMTLGQRITVLDRGRIQQTGTPLELYERPANRFVAGFIGQMNFLPARIEEQSLCLGNVRLPLDPATVTQRGSGREVLVGIRPEHLELVPESGLPGTVELIEALGAETFLHLSTPLGPTPTPLVARGPGSTCKHLGERVYVAPCATKIHLFDPEDGRSLRLPG
ncbi:MAG: hypothetical protein A2284_08235 [Deltaproteobacteria bacterium RIFOXYA12_FULL_61_11]|nr:MAG: hypothetical protein A2284_08235 [Deltaproteobacteria bacterium RIFOXYA12_FULL_61_11]